MGTRENKPYEHTDRANRADIKAQEYELVGCNDLADEKANGKPIERVGGKRLGIHNATQFKDLVKTDEATTNT